jgi:leucine dehydrogenase
MFDALGAWDGQGIVVHRDRPSGGWFLIGIHDTTLGPAAGGTRMKIYPSLDDAVMDVQRLAVGMTRKSAIAGLPFGGGKAVLALPMLPTGMDRRDLLLRYADLVESLRGTFVTATDVGTTSEDMDVIGERTRFVFAKTVAAGGSGSSGVPTARGVRHAIAAALRDAFGTAQVRGRTIAIQGLGSVGGHLAELLAQDDARLVVADVDPDRARDVAHRVGATVVDPATILMAECDVLAPCALGGILDSVTIDRLRCRVVAGAANNQLTEPADAERLGERGILYAPDYVINAGGAIGIIGKELLGWDDHVLEERLVGIGRTLATVFDSARRLGIPTAEAAERLAAERIHDARSARAA